MKNLLILILLFSFSPVFADSLNAPKWTDFCENGYENAVYEQDNNSMWNIFSFVKTEKVKQNYWAKRRKSFESYLKNCNELTDNAQDACYSELVKIENEKNNLYYTKRKQLLYENNIDIHKL